LKRWPFKDPDELLDYEVNWAARLGTDTISSVAWTVPDGIVKEDEAATGAVVSIWLSGGTEGQSYNVGCRVLTTGGRTYDETIVLPVRSR
jgi:ribosomal protein S28E/S33